MKKLTSLLLALIMLFTALTLSGCRWDYQAEGYYYPYDYKYYLSQSTKSNWEIFQFYAVSNNNTFSVDNISFDLMFGTHPCEYMGVNERYRTKYEDCYSYYYFYPDHSLRGEYFFALYILDAENRQQFENENAYIDNIENIENYQLIKKISEEQAFSEEYGYLEYGYFSIVPLKYYKHIEPFTVPAEYIKDNYGTFTISIVLYWKDYSEDCYIVDEERIIEFDYKKVDENTIKIEFNESKN